MNPLPVSAKSLHGRQLRIGDEILENASLFPFFDNLGQVKQVLVLSPDSPQIQLLRWRVGDFVVPLGSSVRVTGESAWLRPVSDDRLAELADLWHYDPRWLLKAGRYRKHSALEYLKASNCADRFTGDVRVLWFRRDLSQLSWVEVRSFSEFNLQRWRSDLLPQRSAAAAPRRRVTGAWRLDPAWLRWPPVHQNARL